MCGTSVSCIIMAQLCCNQMSDLINICIFVFVYLPQLYIMLLKEVSCSCLPANLT